LVMKYDIVMKMIGMYIDQQEASNGVKW